MKRLFRAFVGPVLVLAMAGCQRSSAPPAPLPAAETTGTASPAPPAAEPGTAPVPLPSTLPGGVPASPPPTTAAKPVPTDLPAVLAMVNGEQVQRWELETALKQAEAASGGPVPAAQRDSVLRGLLDELITYHMLAQEARSRKIAASEAEVDAEMATIRKSFPTEEAYQQALLLQGVTADQLRQVTRLGMQTKKIIDSEITAKVAVQDAQVDAFYNRTSIASSRATASAPATFISRCRRTRRRRRRTRRGQPARRL